jgi:hypothetical protein
MRYLIFGMIPLLLSCGKDVTQTSDTVSMAQVEQSIRSYCAEIHTGDPQPFVDDCVLQHLAALKRAIE